MRPFFRGAFDGVRIGLVACGVLAVIFAALIFAARAYASETLLVGDSHTWLSPAYEGWEVDAQPGRNSTAAYDVLDRKLRGRHDRVVFDIATNDWPDPDTFRANLRRVWQRIGERELVLVDTYWPGNAPLEEINATLTRFARLHPKRSTLVEWATVAARHPEYLSGDGVHFNAEGYERRSRMVWKAAP